ncbi:hypothetical protein [Vibrio sp. WXL103]|uniref:hypothetical protein n=1 Tax=Vibrio sp. WXL103 TaxID=3450710 RepID=UPI003EC92A48
MSSALLSLTSLVVTCCAIITGISLFNAQLSVEHQLKRQFEQQSEGIIEASKSYATTDELFEHLMNSINRDLPPVEHSARFIPLISATEVTLERVDYPAMSTSYDVSFVLDNQPVGAVMGFKHRYQLFGVLGYIIVSGLVVALMVAWVRRARVERQLAINPTAPAVELNLLGTSIVDQVPSSQRDALKSQLTTMTDTQMEWLKWGLDKFACSDKAMQVALADDGVHFDLVNKQLLIRGIEIAVPKTPFFYYYWYALRKRQQQTAYTNPANNKPDRVTGKELADIMDKYGGIDRTIEELNTVGMRAKNLDLNRNKIKERLTAELGDLARFYLFESQRDPRVARYQYQLAISADNISVSG